MPALSAQATIYRSGKYTYTGYLSTPTRTVVLSGTVSAVPSYPALAVAYTLDTGSESDVVADMDVDFFDNTGRRKGRLRIASGATTTSTSLKVAEFSAGTYNVVIGDTFEVYRTFSIYDRLVAASASLDKDSRVAYTDQNENQPPVCNSGGVSPGFSTSRDFYGSTSFTVDPDSGGTITHAWDFIDGTPSTSASANPTGVVFPVGFRWVKHTATDATNSKSTIQYVPVWVHDTSTYEPLRVEVESTPATVDNGWTMTFRLPYSDESALDNLPDGALVCFWEREYYGGTEVSYGSNVTGKSHVKFAGYLIRDSIRIDPDNNDVLFEATNPLGILQLTPALPQLMLSDSTPANWQGVKTLSTKKMFHYINYWHSTLQTAWDFVWTDGLDLVYDRIAVEGNTIADQLRDIANSLNVQVTCDRLGRIQFIRDPHYLSTSDRNSRTKTYDLTTADVIDFDATWEHRGTTKSVRGEGITTTGAPVFSNAPGDAPSPIGTSSDTLAKQIVSSQSDLNTRAGFHYARMNSLYNGQFVPKGARLTLPDGYGWFDPAHREFVTFTLPASSNKRARGFDTTTRWSVEAVDISYDIQAGTKTVTLTLDHETYGVAGTTYIPPQESSNGLDFPPLDLSFPGFDFDLGGNNLIGLVPGTTTLAVFCSDNKVYITTNFETPEAAGMPTWAATDLTALAGWPGGTVCAFTVDAYSPKYIGTGTAVNGWLCTTTHVMRVTDIFGSIAISSTFAFRASSDKRNMDFERGVQNWGIVGTWYNADGTYAAYTTDGVNWTEVLVTAEYLTATGNTFAPGLHVSPHVAGKALITTWTTTGDTVTAVADVYVSLDYGATWAALASPDPDPGIASGSALVVPYTNTGATVIYHARRLPHASVSPPRLYRATPAGSVNISPTVGLNSFGPFGTNQREIAIPDSDPNTLMLFATSEATLNFAIFLTHNASAATPTWATVVAPSSSDYRQIYALSSFQFIFIGANGVIGFVTETTIDNRKGNISTGGEHVGICGG